MPTEHIRFSFKYEELSDEAKQKAVENIAEKLGGDWWDEHDNDAIREVMIFTLAEHLKTPGWDKFGPGDFPGIDKVTVSGFRVGWGDFLALNATLDRDNAPGLPWHEHAVSVELSESGDSTRVHVAPVEELEFDCTLCGQKAIVLTGWDKALGHVNPDGNGDEAMDADHDPYILEGLPQVDSVALGKLKNAVENAVSAALTAGSKEEEYKTSAEYAREHIEANEPDFNEDGSLF